MADNPNTPGPDPMCADRNAMEWVEAWLNKKEPPKNKVGLMYMLAGGTPRRGQPNTQTSVQRVASDHLLNFANGTIPLWRIG
jgi:hypothetical protein